MISTSYMIVGAAGYFGFLPHTKKMKTRLANYAGAKCSIDGCEKKAIARTWCYLHLGRFKRTGDPNKVLIAKPTKDQFVSLDGPCLVDGCKAKRKSKGYCNNHYYKFWKHGSAIAGKTKVHKNGQGTFANGYHFTTIVIDGVYRQVGTHRLVMEEKLGRKLRPNENVHHINGVRSDNRPENLELWVKIQPSGQRPEDLVKWAWDILELYAKEVNNGSNPF